MAVPWTLIGLGLRVYPEFPKGPRYCYGAYYFRYSRPLGVVVPWGTTRGTIWAVLISGALKLGRTPNTY